MSCTATSVISTPSSPTLSWTVRPGSTARPSLYRDATGTGTVAGNLTRALEELFGPLAQVILGLFISRDGLRARLRLAGSTGVPILTEAAAMIASYLAGERELGRVAPDANVDTLAPALIGAAHLLFAGGKGTPAEALGVQKVVTTVIAGVVRDPASSTG